MSSTLSDFSHFHEIPWNLKTSRQFVLSPCNVISMSLAFPLGILTWRVGILEIVVNVSGFKSNALVNTFV